MKLSIEGNEPLIGNVRASGSKISALKIIAASLFSNEDIIINNVPHIEYVLEDLAIVESLGVKVSWLSANKILINASSMDKYVIPYEKGCGLRTLILLVGPLLYRFGKASIPKFDITTKGKRPINRFINTWEKLGCEISEDQNYYHIQIVRPTEAEINFKTVSVMGTENALLSSIFNPGQTILTNSSTEPETDELISFLQDLGADIKRSDDRKVVINGVTSFGKTNFTLRPDRGEVAMYAVAALLTCGDIRIDGIISGDLLSFVRKLELLSANFEFGKDSLRVWRSKDQPLNAINIEITPAPGFIHEWQPLITILLTQANGISYVHDTVYIDRFSYVKDLKRIGAKIDLLKPSDAGINVVVSDDSYDISLKGEPYTVAKIEGPTTLKKGKFFIPDLTFGPVLLLAALAAEGKSEVYGIETLERGYEDLRQKFTSLGAKIAVND